jgi:DNA-directed RNA polymerase specialized sigma24 family protein
MIRESIPDIQWKVYQKHHLGYSYKEISHEFGISEKDVDNIIQKIKKKVRVMFDTE